MKVEQQFWKSGNLMGTGGGGKNPILHQLMMVSAHFKSSSRQASLVWPPRSAARWVPLATAGATAGSSHWPLAIRAWRRRRRACVRPCNTAWPRSGLVHI